MSAEPVPYPFGPEVGLEVDERLLALQRQGPVRVQLPQGEPCWLATSYEDVRAVHGDRRFCKELGVGKVLPRPHPSPPLDPSQLANMDPPRHTRLRKLTTTAFAKPRIGGLQPWLQELVDEAFARLVQEGPGADFTATIAWDLPNFAMTGILGIERSEVPEFRAYIETMLNPKAERDARAAAMGDLRAFVTELVAARRAQPADDLLSELVLARDEQDRLTEDELVMLAINLFLAGFETTYAQLGATLFTLLSRPERWDELVRDRALLPAAMEELWRWVPTTRYGVPLCRWASEDVELGNGVVIPQGEAIIGERVAANRDEAVFPHAAEIDFHRDHPAPHLALGWGAHHCVGAHLADLEILLTLEKLLDELPTLRLAVDPDEIQWSDTSMLRSVTALPVAW